MKTFFILALFGLSIVCSSRAQTAGPSSGVGSTNSLAVQIWSPSRGKTFHAPATIHIRTYVASNAPEHAGDVVTVEYFANTNRLGSRRCVWHDAIRPQPHPGYAIPMFIIAPGFSPVELVWSNAPAGSYALTARASRTNGLSAVSAPVNVTVLP